MYWPSVITEIGYLLQSLRYLEMARLHALLTPGCIAARPPALPDAVAQLPTTVSAGSRMFVLGNQDLARDYCSFDDSVHSRSHYSPRLQQPACIIA